MDRQVDPFRFSFVEERDHMALDDVMVRQLLRACVRCARMLTPRFVVLEEACLAQVLRRAP